MPETLRALVVDDDPIASKTVMFALEQEGFRCDLAVDGEDALRQLDDDTYDLVVTDLRMPNKHGHALSLELLEKQPRPHHRRAYKRGRSASHQGLDLARRRRHRL
ncbi:MAG: response regulator [Planctomycetota bacterium]|nr:response regulator [Planctomycetota bacterium]